MRRRHPGRRLFSRRPPDDVLSLAVIPDGALSLLTSSRTARSAEPGSRRASRKGDWIPGSACGGPGMTAKKRNVTLAAALSLLTSP